MKLNREQWNSVRAEWTAMKDVFADCSIDATSLLLEFKKRIKRHLISAHMSSVFSLHPSSVAPQKSQVGEAF
jgi:hypothetical protein